MRGNGPCHNNGMGQFWILQLSAFILLICILPIYHVLFCLVIFGLLITYIYVGCGYQWKVEFCCQHSSMDSNSYTISFLEIFSSKSPNLIHDHWYFSNPNVLYYASFFSISYCCITLIELILFMLYDKMILYDEMSVFVQKMYLITIKFVLIPYYFHLLLLF